MIKDILNDAESRMRGAIQVLHDDLAAIRTGGPIRVLWKN